MSFWNVADFMITKYGGVVEAKTVQWSSLLCLVHPYQSLLSKGLYVMYFVLCSLFCFSSVTFTYIGERKIPIDYFDVLDNCS